MKEFDGSPDKVKLGFQDSIFAPTSFTEVCVGMDTRETSKTLVAAVKKACDIFGVRVCDFGLVTTPQLHWLVSNRYTHFNDAGLYVQYFKEKFLTFVGLCQNSNLGK